MFVAEKVLLLLLIALTGEGAYEWPYPSVLSAVQSSFVCPLVTRSKFLQISGQTTQGIGIRLG